jgi:23S rRNA (adenine2503-C2)-methyltransferase
MMPINRQYSLEQLKEALLAYPYHPRYGLTFEYILIQGLNDSLEHARKLVHYLKGLKAKVNLIPMNAHPGLSWQASSEETIREFQAFLWSKKIPAPVRYSRGQDVSAACGQLAAKASDEIHLKPSQSRYFQTMRETSSLPSSS